MAGEKGAGAVSRKTVKWLHEHWPAATVSPAKRTPHRR
jgi:hypothetical protein